MQVLTVSSTPIRLTYFFCRLSSKQKYFGGAEPPLPKYWGGSSPSSPPLQPPMKYKSIYYLLVAVFSETFSECVTSLQVHVQSWKHFSELLWQLLRPKALCLADTYSSKIVYNILINLHIEFFNFEKWHLDLCSLKILLRVLNFHFPWRCSWYYCCKVHTFLYPLLNVGSCNASVAKL